MYVMKTGKAGICSFIKRADLGHSSLHLTLMFVGAQHDETRMHFHRTVFFHSPKRFTKLKFCLFIYCCLPLSLIVVPFKVPCNFVLAMPKGLEMLPYHRSLQMINNYIYARLKL